MRDKLKQIGQVLDPALEQQLQALESWDGVEAAFKDIEGGDSDSEDDQPVKRAATAAPASKAKRRVVEDHSRVRSGHVATSVCFCSALP